MDPGVCDLRCSFGVECETGQCIVGDLKGLLGAINETEEGFFYELKVAVVTRGHLECDVLDGMKFGGGLSGVAPNEFEYIGVSLLGHDA